MFRRMAEGHFVLRLYFSLEMGITNKVGEFRYWPTADVNKISHKSEYYKDTEFICCTKYYLTIDSMVW